MDLKRGIDLAVDKILNDLKSRAKKLGSSGEIAQVGTISANGEEEIGKKIAEAMDKVGRDGVITVRSPKLEIQLWKQLKECNLIEVICHHIL